jgi:hypothetical protein
MARSESSIITIFGETQRGVLRDSCLANMELLYLSSICGKNAQPIIQWSARGYPP